MYRDLMIPGEILCGRHHRVCRVTNWETLERWGMHYKERAIPGLFTREWCGWVSLDLCVNVCVIVDLRWTASTLQLILWLQLHPCGAGRSLALPSLCASICFLDHVSVVLGTSNLVQLSLCSCKCICL